MDKKTFDTYITLSILIPILIMASIGQVLILTEPSEDIEMINGTEHANTNIHTYPDVTLEYESVENGTDTDKDGFTDSYERRDTILDPDKKDIIVYIVYTDDARLSQKDLKEIKSFYNNSPIDGGQGLNIHFIEDEYTMDKQVTYQTTARHFISDVSGIHKKSSYVLYVTHSIDVSATSNVLGFAHNEYNYLAIETSNNDEKITLVHELGHSFGLLPSKNPAIDSRAVSYNDYPSIMNYNYRYSGSDELVYADNGYYDDWQMIEEQLNETEYLFG